MKKALFAVAVATTLFLSCSKNGGGDAVTPFTVTTDSIKNISYKSVEIISTVVSGGTSTVTSRGVCYNTVTKPTVLNNTVVNGSGNGTFATTLTGLTPNTTYYVRAFAINKTDTAYGNESIFKTIALGLPVISTTAITNAKQTSANSGGTITSDGGSNITTKGVCWSVSSNPTTADTKIAIGAGAGSFTAALSSLSPGSTYYVRAYATNSLGTTYGNEVSLTTLPFTIAGAGVTDIDGNSYPTVILGDKEWMAGNLKVTKYRNGDLIVNVTDNNIWSNTTSGAWCYYSNNSGVNNLYGKLYNWYAVADSRGVCPANWHVPTDGEFAALNGYVGGGGALKEVGTSNWVSPNYGATNASGFTARPAGERNSNGSFVYQGTYTSFWTTVPYGTNPLVSLDYYLFYNTSNFTIDNDYNNQGLSVRCIKD